jgi:hypothetical protein
VDDAEEIVGAVWIQILIEQRDQARTALKAAIVRGEDARRCLAATLLDREPRGIAAAHADLEESLADARSASRDYEQAQKGLVLELDLLTWRAVERKVEACIARNGGRRNESATPATEIAQRPQYPERPVTLLPVSLLSRLSRRALRWFVYAVVTFTAHEWSS